MKQIRVAIAGLGTVGASVFKNLESKSTFKIVAVSAKNKSKDRGLNLTGVTWVENPIDLATRSDIDVIVESFLLEDVQEQYYEDLITFVEFANHIVNELAKRSNH